jgi:hypothetical protein
MAFAFDDDSDDDVEPESFSEEAESPKEQGEEGEAVMISEEEKPQPKKKDEYAKMVNEIVSTVKQAADGQKVTKIRIAIGPGVGVARSRIASTLHKNFPAASIEILDSKIIDSVVVKDIEVE